MDDYVIDNIGIIEIIFSNSIDIINKLDILIKSGEYHNKYFRNNYTSNVIGYDSDNEEYNRNNVTLKIKNTINELKIIQKKYVLKIHILLMVIKMVIILQLFQLPIIIKSIKIYTLKVI